MAQTKGKRIARGRRRFTEEFKREALPMLLDGHSALSVAQRLGLSGPNLLYRWKQAASIAPGQRHARLAIVWHSSKTNSVASSANSTS